MNWESRIVGADELRRYLQKKSPADFRHLVRALMAQQRTTWPMLREGVTGLAEVKYKKLRVKGAEVLAQYNPGRTVSVNAKVDAEAIKERPCFLCVDNLPPEERGVGFGDDFVALCNPAPILSRHLVVSSRRHTRQLIAGSFAALLDLTRELGDEYFTLYNGPACGASAPDHLHFQACERKWLPIFGDVESRDRLVLANEFGIETFILKNYHVNALIARGVDRDALGGWFERSLKLLAEVTASAAEPMLNLVATRDGGRWTVIVFPRRKHRPACYYAEGEAQLTVSPGAFDLAGMLVVPQAEHFARITSEDAEKILAEVTLDDEHFNHWVKTGSFDQPKT
jgi:hypothetical protein